ncbi:MAG: hypothetical protein JXX28_09335 [Deltaproteobacteria bacterium]|nr:hypothetical protein [Deltaproteobacteria bacterium]
MIVLLLLLSLASAQPVQVSTGADIAAWRLLAAEEGEARVAALRGFVLRYPTSSLAELAWAELEEEGAEGGAWSRPVRGQVVRLQRSLRAHRQDLISGGVTPAEGERRRFLLW